MGSALREKTLALVWSHASELASLEDTKNLVHGDFGKRNIIVRQTAGTWTVAAVLDWEFAFSGPSLADVGHFLRLRTRVASNRGTSLLRRLPKRRRQVA